MTTAGRPVYLRVRSIGLVFAGGVLGTGVRSALSRLVPPLAEVPVVIVGVNVLGAFVLGLLLERLARTGADDGWRRDLRLGVGTGVLGGFTTYSALATDTATLLLAGHPGRAVGYAGGTLVLGLLAAAGGTWCAGRRTGAGG